MGCVHNVYCILWTFWFHVYNQVSRCFKTTGSDHSVCTILSDSIIQIRRKVPIEKVCFMPHITQCSAPMAVCRSLYSEVNCKSYCTHFLYCPAQQSLLDFTALYRPLRCVTRSLLCWYEPKWREVLTVCTRQNKKTSWDLCKTFISFCRTTNCK